MRSITIDEADRAQIRVALRAPGLRGRVVISLEERQHATPGGEHPSGPPIIVRRNDSQQRMRRRVAAAGRAVGQAIQRLEAGGFEGGVDQHHTVRPWT